MDRPCPYDWADKHTGMSMLQGERLRVYSIAGKRRRDCQDEDLCMKPVHEVRQCASLRLY